VVGPQVAIINRRSAFELSARLGLSALALRGMRGFRPLWLTVLAYHRVCEYEPVSPWDTDLVSATPEGFRQQLDFIKEHFTPTTSREIALWRQGKFTLPRNPIVLTFDDGYLDNYSVALPLLLHAGVPADFFICPWNIENRRLFWWDKIAFCLRKSHMRSIVLSYPLRLHLDINEQEATEASRLALLKLVKNTRDLDIERFVSELQQKADVQLDERKEAEKLLMRWEHVCALRRAGMGIGSHSYSHPILPLHNDEAIWKEMTDSKFAIESRLRNEVFALSYPVGTCDNRTKTLARQAGYDIAYTYCSGASFLHSVDSLEIRRIGVERYMSLAYFRTMVALPFLT